MQPCWTPTRLCSRTRPWPSKMAAQSNLDAGLAKVVLAAWQPLTEELKLHSSMSRPKCDEADVAAFGKSRVAAAASMYSSPPGTKTRQATSISNAVQASCACAHHHSHCCC